MFVMICVLCSGYRFSRHAYVDYVSERTPVGAEILRLVATDADEAPELEFSRSDDGMHATDRNGISLARDALRDAVLAFR